MNERPTLKVSILLKRRLFQPNDTVILKHPPLKNAVGWQKRWIIDGFYDEGEVSLAFLSRADGTLSSAPATDLIWQKGRGFPMRERLIDG